MSNTRSIQTLSRLIATHIDTQLRRTQSIKGYSRILRYLKNFLVKYGDPLVTYNLHGYDIELPLSHQLPDILKQWPHYSANLGRLAHYVNHKYADLTFIDIGANVGDSIAIVRKLSEIPILCVEGDVDFLEILRRNVQKFKDVDIAPFFIGDREISIIAKSSGFGGTAHLSILEENNTSVKIQMRTLDGILAQNERFASSKMLKIDTDGFDCKIIRGSLDFLSTSKPIIFFEYDPFFLKEQDDDGTSIFLLLKENGYSGVFIYDNFGDLMLCLPEIQMERLEELHLYFSGRKSLQYYDICVFHSEDLDIFNSARNSEIEFFRELKS